MALFPLHNEVPTMSEDEQRPPPLNPFAPPALPLVDSEPVPAQSLEEQQLRAFVGSRADYYLQKWAPLQTARGHRTGFNWAAFFLSGLWLPYRKMYKVATVFFAIILVESVAEEVLFVGILGKAETPAGLSNAVGLLVSIICGAYGNRWYLLHATKVISDIRAQGLDQEAMLEALSRRGGTSLGASLGLFFLFMVVMFAVFFVLEVVLYQA
jgi:hypothetical protein